MEGFVEKDFPEEPHMSGVSPYAVIHCKSKSGLNQTSRCHVGT